MGAVKLPLPFWALVYMLPHVQAALTMKLTFHPLIRAQLGLAQHRDALEAQVRGRPALPYLI